MQSTLKVKGIGRMQMPPDEIHLALELVTKEKEYARAMEEAARRLRALEESLSAEGFRKESIQTAYFSVDTKYTYVKEERQFDGYEIKQKLSVAFEMDTKRLGRSLQAVVESNTDPEIGIRFRLKDPGQYRVELLQRAARDARQTAEALAEECSASLGSLLEIKTDPEEADFVSPMQFNASSMAAFKGVQEMEFRPTDVTEEAEVYFVWELLEG